MFLRSSKLFRILPLVFLFIFSSCGKSAKKQDQSSAEKSIFVKFEPATLGSIIQEFNTAGEIKANKEVVIATERSGMLQRIFVKEGQSVVAGQELFVIEGEDVDADLVKAQSDYDSYKKLYDQGAIPKLTLLAYETQLKKAETQKNDLHFKVGFSGVIGQIYVDPGDYLKLADPVLELVNLYPLRVSYTIPEKLIAKIKIGQPAKLTTDSEPDKIFDAQVDFISPRVDPATRTVLVRALIKDPGRALKANQYVNVNQILQQSDKVLLIKEQAIYLDQGQEYVYIAEALDGETKDQPENPNAPPPATHVAKRVPVKTGLRKPGYVEIIEGVKEGDNVIYAGLTGIYPGAKLVRILEEDDGAQK